MAPASALGNGGEELVPVLVQTVAWLVAAPAAGATGKRSAANCKPAVGTREYSSSPTCTVYSVQCTVYSVQCTVYSVQCTVYSVQCTVYSVQCTVCSVQCTVYSVQCALCSVQCTVHVS